MPDLTLVLLLDAATVLAGLVWAVCGLVGLVGRGDGVKSAHGLSKRE